MTQLLLEWKSDLNKNDAAGRLCDAASAGDLDALKLILEHGVDPNSGDYDDRTPLHLAAAEGHMKAVQYLISKGSDVNFKANMPSPFIPFPHPPTFIPPPPGSSALMPSYDNESYGNEMTRRIGGALQPCRMLCKADTHR